MNARSIIAAAAVVLMVTLPFWTALPAATGFVPFQALFGAIVYLLEITLMAALIMTVVDGRLRTIAASAAVGFVAGLAPGLAVLPAAVFVPLWFKAIVPAVVLGILISRGRKPGWSFAGASVLAAAFLLVDYLQRGDLLVELVNQVNASVERMLTGSAVAGGYDSETVNSLVDQALFLTRILVRLLPGLIIMSGICQLFVAFLMTEWYYTRRDSYFPGFGPFIYWKVPEKVLYFLGIVLVVRLTINGAVQMAADNIAFILLILYAVCGLALIEYALRKLRLPVVIRTVFYLGLGVLLIQIFGLIATAIAGLFDSYFDFRKVRARTLG